MNAINFPTFVLVVGGDDALACVMDLSGKRSLHAVTAACKRPSCTCLAWFTSAVAAEVYVANMAIEGKVVPINSAYQATAFLGTNEFSAMMIDPVDAADDSQVVEYDELFEIVHGLAGGVPVAVMNSGRLAVTPRHAVGQPHDWGIEGGSLG
jgi:hypothetical protein